MRSSRLNIYCGFEPGRIIKVVGKNVTLIRIGGTYLWFSNSQWKMVKSPHGCAIG
jgi:hypothetical protein